MAHPLVMKMPGNRVLPPNSVFIGRGSMWGNPYTHLPLKGTKALYQVKTRADAIEGFKTWFWTKTPLIEAVRDLKGKILVCYCSPLSCHGEYLVLLSNMTNAEFAAEAAKYNHTWRI